MNFRERMNLQRETKVLVDDLLARLDLPRAFSLQQFVLAVAGDLGIDLRTFSASMPSEIGGLGLAGDDKAIILVNRRQALLAEDYTILHELGHFVLGHLDPDHVADARDEIQADLFAGAVLERMLHGSRARRPSIANRLKLFFQG